MSRFEINYKKISLPLIHPFGISRGSRTAAENVFIQLKCEGIEGFGEAAPNTRYGKNPGKVIRFIEKLPEDIFDGIEENRVLSERLDRLKPQVQSAKAAVEMAWVDWQAKRGQQPLWKRWQAPSDRGPVSSFTIGIDRPEVMQQKVMEAETEDYPIYKIKLGGTEDRAVIRAIREVTDKPIRVDANEGWNSLEEAKREIKFLENQNVELVEQPMPADYYDDLVKLKAWSPLPLCADESFVGSEDLGEIARAFDIVNIKLMKIGSLWKARRAINRIHRAEMQVMIGCMIESSLANTAGGVLSLWADYTDLDGHLLIAEDPFRGLQLDDEKRIVVPDTPGLGAEPVGDIW